MMMQTGIFLSVTIGNSFDMEVFSNLQKHIQHFKVATDATVSPTLPERQGYGLENTVLRLSIFL